MTQNVQSRSIHEDFFKQVDGRQYVAYYPTHGFEIIELKYTFENEEHKLTATKLKGDVHVLTGKVTWYVCAKGNEERLYPLEGFCQIAQFGYRNPRFINGRLSFVSDDKSIIVFDFIFGSFVSPLIFFLREGNHQIMELDSHEEELYSARLRDFSSTISMMEDYVGSFYQIGGSRSASRVMIDENTELFEYEKDADEQCVICLLKFKKNEKCRKIKQCNHIFHAECIEKWLLRCNECPLDKKALPKK